MAQKKGRERRGRKAALRFRDALWAACRFSQAARLGMERPWLNPRPEAVPLGAAEAGRFSNRQRTLGDENPIGTTN